ncbi:hypothetical protein H8S90_22215 [Olivibacter sp. SDN3]|nr:hypothetical protein [Olivibacter sp. SDN3]QNL49411.1 hypothetical protein H8S90_22215 [Olivibacter sp. SDN3]
MKKAFIHYGSFKGVRDYTLIIGFHRTSYFIDENVSSLRKKLCDDKFF